MRFASAAPGTALKLVLDDPAGEANRERDQSAGYARRRHLHAIADAGSIPAASTLSGPIRKYVTPRVVTGGCWARTQEATRSSAARADEDAAQRRRMPLECHRIHGEGH